MEKKKRKLADLLKGLDYTARGTDPNSRVSKVMCNSNYVSKGDLFVALKGERTDGREYIRQAARKGAEYFVVDRKYGEDNDYKIIKVNDTKKALARITNNYYGFPSKKINVIGITGTNGKTTTSYVLESVLKAAGKGAGVIGSINYRLKDKILDSKNTTPGCLQFHALLNEMVKERLEFAVCEISSHALKQRRTEGISFKYAVYTNLSPEHLDYHKTMDDYFRSKLKLFKSLSSRATAIVNIDDPFGRRIIEQTKAKTVAYSARGDINADVKCKDPELSLKGTDVRVITPGFELSVKSNLVGAHNVYNILAAAAFAYHEGISADIFKAGIESLRIVPGRFEVLRLGQPFNVVVDYAHTEDALAKVLAAARALTKNRIILVFGCGGDRDREKRPKMGNTASRLSDFFFITNDNPRNEDPNAIAEDIRKGIPKRYEDYRIILPRAEAIKAALRMAGSEDTVLIAGKGHEDYQIFRDKAVHFSDKETVAEEISLLTPSRL
jgi:UDP-N-acetylmuramoyl-L-alanyl-D-glutamate--2,6-diaminopimelate ligase